MLTDKPAAMLQQTKRAHKVILLAINFPQNLFSGEFRQALERLPCSKELV
ncbi:MAG: hypothetical protein ABI068_13820 [Ktedonobacterales bacterium]